MNLYDPVVTWRNEPYVDPRPVMFTCCICERSIYEQPWRVDGRSRQIAPICHTCEAAYGGCNNGSWKCSRMDGRMIRRVKAAAVFLECLAYRKTQERKRRGA